MQFIVDNEHDGLSLSKYVLSKANDIPSWAVREAFRNRDVKIDGQRAKENDLVQAGQSVTIYLPKRYLTAERKVLPVLYEDQRILAVEKPQGLLSIGESGSEEGDSAYQRAKAYIKNKGEDESALRLCHRLDVMTGGILILAKDEETYELMTEAFAGHELKKTYICRVKGCPMKKEAILEGWLRKDPKAALVSITDYPVSRAVPIQTRYKVLEAGEISRLEVELITGKTHQIRAHLSHIGHPILGDDKYGDRDLNRRFGLRRQQLWHARVSFSCSGILSYLNSRDIRSKAPF